MTSIRTVSALLIVATLLVAGPVAGTDLVAIDGETALTDQATIDSYQQNGSVTVDTTQLLLSLTVAETAEGANASGGGLPGADAGATYLCADYDESVARTVRFYVPAEYFSPQDTTLQAIGDGPEAQLDPVDQANTTAVRIRFSDPGRYCYEVDDVNGQISDIKRWSNDVLNTSFGVSLPGFGGEGTPWSYVNDSAWADSSEVAIDESGELTIQYDDSPNATDPTWVSVPECRNPSEQPVCIIDERANATTLYAVGDAPPIRYRQQSGPSIGGVSVPDITSGVRDVLEGLTDRLPDLLWGDG